MENIVQRYQKGKFIYGSVLAVNENGTEKFQKVCKKCNGTGVLQVYHRIDNGICYQCMGTGKGTIINKLQVLTNDEIKEDMINTEIAKRRTKNEVIPSFILKEWKNESIEMLSKIFNI